MVLWRELRSMGFAGGNKQVHRWLAERRTVPAKVGPCRGEDPHGDQTLMGRGKGPPSPAARQLAWLLVQPLAALDAWLAEVRACGIGAVETFAAGLEVDGAALRAALTEPRSSGQAEGQVNRFKLLKRQSYGRASFDLLRRRVVLAA